jgi:hypothetical protein
MHYSGNDDVVKCFGYISAYQDSKEIYFVIFGHVYKFLLIFRVGNDFC